jgi:hypothetical protein
VTQSVVDTVQGAGSTTAVSVQIIRGASSIIGVGSTTALTVTIARVTTNGAGSVTAQSTVVFTGTASKTGVGSTTAAAIREINTDAAFDVQAQIVLSGLLERNATATLTSTANAAGDALLERSATAALTAIGAITSVATSQGAEYAYALVGDAYLDAQAIAGLRVDEYSYGY